MFTANLFIIPNRAGKVTSEDAEITRKIAIDDNNDLAKAFNFTINGEPVEYKLNEPLVEVWVTGLSSENWSDHGLPEELYSLEMIQKGELPLYASRLPSRIPLRYLKGYKEGHALMAELNGKQVKIYLTQRGYRYQRFGDFEEVLEQVTA